jgi:hypothetical protein
LRDTAAPGIPLAANLGGILLLLVARQIASHRLNGVAPYGRVADNLLIIAGVLTLWLFVGDWVAATSRTFFLTISWGAVGAGSLIAGFLLKSRTYRLLGLGILAVSIARVFLVDVWQLETIYRILSFLILGGILVAAGFLYNRFADVVRKLM